MIYGYNIQLCQTLCSAQRNQLQPLLWLVCSSRLKTAHFQAEEMKYQHKMKTCTLQKGSGSKKEAGPLKKHLLIFNALAQALCNALPSALSLARTLLPHGGSQMGPPGHIHQTPSKNYARGEKGECKYSQRPIYYSHFDFPLSFMQHLLPVRNIQNYYGSSSLDILIPGKNQSILKNIA